MPLKAELPEVSKVTELPGSPSKPPESIPEAKAAV